MMTSREVLKSMATAIFSAIGREHPIGHQDNKAERYLLRNGHGDEIEIMFEKNLSSPANIWVQSSKVAQIPENRVKQSRSPASKLYKDTGADGNKRYGRHSALQSMPVLSASDLIYFAPTTAEELGLVIDAILAGPKGAA